MPVRLMKHEAVPQCGSYEVRFLDGKPSRYGMTSRDAGKSRLRF
jgi:hypothetical protein